MRESLAMLWKIYRKLDRIDLSLEKLSRRREFFEEDCVWESEDSDELESYQSVEMQLQPYRSVLAALCGGSCHRMILLQDGYEFAPEHTKDEVLLYQHKDSNPAGYPLKLQMEDNRIGFDELHIESLTGTFYGGVVLNEVGLLFYIKFVRGGYSVSDGNLTFSEV